MISTFKLINSYFWKTIYGPIIAFIFPILLLLVVGNIFKIQYIYPGIIAMSMLFVCTLSLPISIMELKESSIFKYIGSSPVNPLKFTFAIISFYILISLISSVIILIITFLAFKDDVSPAKGFEFGILGGIISFPGIFFFLISLSIHLLFVIIIGLLISTISKTAQQALTIGLIILIPSIFLSGMIISVDIIAQSSFLNWVSRINPFRYSTGNMVIASTPKDQIGDMFQTLTYEQKEIIFAKDTLSADGQITFEYGGEKFKINSMEDLEAFQNKFGVDQLKTFRYINDIPLYELTFEKAIKTKSMYSDNNIFNWENAWSVRRVPQVATIKKFITDYFLKITSGNENIGRALEPISKQILEQKFGWLEVFLKQTNILYLPVERALNLLIPLSFSVYSTVYIWNNFKWNAK